MPVEVPPYPVNLLLAGRRVLVVGGGAVAAEKVRGLLAAGAIVQVVAPRVNEEVRALPVAVELRAYARGEVAAYRLGVACTDDPAVSRPRTFSAATAPPPTTSTRRPARRRLTG